MKSYIQLTKIAETYYDIWTSDGIDTFHADAHEIAVWLKRKDLRTDSDAALEDLTGDEIGQIAEMIADKVKENLDSANELTALTGQKGHRHEIPEN